MCSIFIDTVSIIDIFRRIELGQPQDRFSEKYDNIFCLCCDIQTKIYTADR